MMVMERLESTALTVLKVQVIISGSDMVLLSWSMFKDNFKILFWGTTLMMVCITEGQRRVQQLVL
jgi:hypothetical protein